jgi:zinc protease
MSAKRYLLIALGMLLVVFFCGSCNQKQSGKPKKSRPKKPANVEINVVGSSEPIKKPEVTIHESKLENGLQVLVLEDHSAPVVTVQVWYRVGSRNERPGIRGLAHLCEHMMFKGSANVGPEEHARIIDSVGGTENAFTSADVTAYYDTVPADRLALAIELEAERMAHAKLDELHFFKEREVVKEEIRDKQQNDPIGALIEKFNSMAFKKHPYNWTVGGTLEDLDKISHADLKAFRDTYYSPNNAVLIVVGDTTAAEVDKLAKKYFGPIATQKTPPLMSLVEPEQKEFRHEELKFPTQLPIIVGGYKIPEAAHEDMAVLKVVANILGRGKSSRLHRALVRDEKVAVFSGAFGRDQLDPGLFLVVAGFLPMIPAKSVEDSLLGQVDKLVKEGPSESELAKAKNQLTSDYIFQLTSMERLGFQIGYAETIEKGYKRFLEKYNAYDGITVGDVKRIAAKYLKRQRLTVAVLAPPKEGEEFEKKAATKVEEAQKKTPTWPTAERFLNLSQVASDPMDLPNITRKTLANGLKILVIERHEQPVVYFDLIVPGGDLLDPAGKAGLGTLMAEMMTQGTKKRSAEQIAAEADGLGGAVAAQSAGEYFTVFGRFLQRDFEKGLDLFADIILNPTFPEEEVAKLRPRLEGGVRHRKNDPAGIGAEHLNYLIYGYGHPRGRPISLETLAALKTKDIADLYRRVFSADHGILAVTGDVEPQETIAAIEKAFGNWSKSDSPIELPKPPSQLAGRIVRLIDKPDLTQATMFVGQLGIKKSNPDFIALALGNYVLGGGGFSSRLMKEIRSKGGKTYGASSAVTAGITEGFFRANTFTRNSETGATLEMLLAEIEKIAQKGITEKELQAAKNNIAGSYVLRLQPPNGIGDEVLMAEFYGLGDDWVKNFKKSVTKPSLKEVNSILKKNLAPEKMALVIVGKAEEIAEQVAKFGVPVKIDFLEAVPDEERKKKGPAKEGKTP